MLVNVCLGQHLEASSDDPVQIIQENIKAIQLPKELQAFDVLSIADNPFNGISHIYFQQKYRDLSIHKAIGIYAFNTKGRSLLKEKRLIRTAEVFVNQKSDLPIREIVSRIVSRFNYPVSQSKLEVKGVDKFELETSFSKESVIFEKVWAKDKTGKFYPSWKVEFSDAFDSDHWVLVINASNGNIIEENNQTIYCKYHEEHEHPSVPSDAPSIHLEQYSAQGKLKNDGAQYFVFPFPIENPERGIPSVITNPSDPIASPFGWHDINLRDGAEFQTLRGNNVHAYQDTAAQNEAPFEEPSGGELLFFNFPFNKDSSITHNINSDITNLFYWNNFMHDWAYKFGFTESAGNFQFNNGALGGNEEDHVLAETLDGSDANNATFSAPRDGRNGRMQMHRWIVGSDFEIINPEDIRQTFESGRASFGPSIDVAISGQMVLLEDSGGGDVNDACNPVRNVRELSGNIALINRGTCDFSFKVYQAQEAGAKACVICNNQDNAPLVTMSAGDSAALVTIPSLFISKEDCAIIKANLSRGVTGKINETRELLSSFDNGIIVHEYGHGISLRLAGGSQTSGCLNNDEQMGEGWSDFLTLVLTQQPDDLAEDARTIGTYVLGQDENGRGIRRYPYSTSLEINPQTHRHIRATSRPHDVGELWALMLWEMYWKFIEQDTYDPTWTNENSGNYKAVQLVFDGLKIQECDPTFVEARDAILEADMLNYNGENTCLIWEAFSKRGLGVGSISGDEDDRNDNRDNFDRPPLCAQDILITKTMTPAIEAGSEVDVTLRIENFKEGVESVIISDQIPDGTRIARKSENFPSSETADEIRFELSNLNFGQSITLTYTLETTDITPAQRAFANDFEGAIGFSLDKDNTALNSWGQNSSRALSGSFSLGVAADTIDGTSLAILNTPISVTSNSNMLLFQNLYDTQLGIDGGVVELSTDNGQTWEALTSEEYILNAPDDIITFNTLYLNTITSFTGANANWNLVGADLSRFIGEDVQLRFRYYSQTYREPIVKEGWFVDDLQVIEKKLLEGVASILVDNEIVSQTSAQTIVLFSDESTPTTEVITDDFRIALYPNPVREKLFLSATLRERGDYKIRFVGILGNVLHLSEKRLSSGLNEWQEDVSHLPPGMHFIELTKNGEKHVLSFIKQ